MGTPLGVISPVLVTGATGVLGPTLVRALVERGATVRVLCRRPPAPGLLPDRVEVRVGDLTRAEDVGAAARGTSRIFHLAALLHRVGPEAASAVDYEAVNLGGTRHVVMAAAAEGISVVFFSSIVVYGPTRGEPVDETSPVRALGPYAETKRRAEDLVLGAGIAAVVLRLAAVYGRRMKGNYRRLADALARGRFVAVGNGGNRRTLVHEGDAVRAALLAAEREEAAGQVFNVTDGEIHSMRRIVAAMCAALGKPVPQWRVPVKLARLAALGADGLCAVGGQPGAYRDLLEKYLESSEVEGRKIRRVLGFCPSRDLESGWREALGRQKT